MPNLVSTYRCNQDCSFCFTGKNSPDSYYTPEILENQLAFLTTFGRTSVNLVGGEPTLNPSFIPVLQWLSEKNFEITVFSNGITSKTVINAIKSLHPEKIRFFINRSEPGSNPEVFDFYRSLGHLVHLAATVYHPGQKLSHIPDEINRYGLNKEFRIGIALPVYKGVDNSFLKPEEYKTAAHELMILFSDCLESGIRPVFDCGFPYCFFNDDQKSFLAGYNIPFSANCGIIPDIDAQNHAFPCFPLRKFCMDISDHDDWKSLERGLQSRLNRVKRNHFFKECYTCNEMINGHCSGGCLSLQFIMPSTRDGEKRD